uniref:C6 domain-containing protein n=1 Tax=Steinernema glaseri TaxID=37863 RepID=A0A1I7YL08_9BILA
MSSSRCHFDMYPWLRMRLHFLYRNTLRWSIVVASMVFINQVSCCMPTQPSQPPTTTPPPNCCPALNQSVSQQFADGVLTFTYNNPTCRTQVFMTCTNPVPQINLVAAIVLNNSTFLAQAANQVNATASCVNGAFTVTGNSSQSIVVQNLFCIVADTTTPGKK